MAEGIDDLAFWVGVPLLALGTFFLRYLPIGLIGDRLSSGLLGRALAYVPAAVLPAIAAPLIAYDSSGALQSDPARLIAVAAAVAAGVLTRNLLWTIFGGMSALWLAEALLALF